jgi:hypothetical protein
MLLLVLLLGSSRLSGRIRLLIFGSRRVPGELRDLEIRKLLLPDLYDSSTRDRRHLWRQAAEKVSHMRLHIGCDKKQ